jgi:hypothetical protein
MKKFFIVLAIGAFAACNNSASTEAKTSDSTKVDSTKVVVDSTKMTTDSTKMAVDSSKMSADTSKKK